MNVFSIQAQFQLPDDFVGDVPAALVLLAAHLRSTPPSADRKATLTVVSIARDAMEAHFREAVTRGERVFGQMSIGILGPAPAPADEVEPEPFHEITADVTS